MASLQYNTQDTSELLGTEKGVLLARFVLRLKNKGANRESLPEMCTYTLPATETSINLFGPTIPFPPSAMGIAVHFLAVSIATLLISPT